MNRRGFFAKAAAGLAALKINVQPSESLGEIGAADALKAQAQWAIKQYSSSPMNQLSQRLDSLEYLRTQTQDETLIRLITSTQGQHIQHNETIFRLPTRNDYMSRAVPHHVKGLDTEGFFLNPNKMRFRQRKHPGGRRKDFAKYYHNPTTIQQYHAQQETLSGQLQDLKLEISKIDYAAKSIALNTPYETPIPPTTRT